MDKESWENKEIIVYWWNFGKRTLDYRGTYKGLLDKKGIRVKGITQNGVKGFHFTIPLFSCKATLDIYDSNYSRCCDEAIKIFFSLLGDKTKIIASQKEFSIN